MTFYVVAAALLELTGQMLGSLPEVMAGPHPIVRGVIARTGDSAHAYHFELAESADPRHVRHAKDWGAPMVRRSPLSGGPQELFDVGCGSVLFHWPTRQGLIPWRWQLAGNTFYFTSYQTEVPWGGDELPRDSRLEAPGGALCGCRLTDRLLAACRVGPAPADRDELNHRNLIVQESANRDVPFVRYTPLNKLFGRRAGKRLLEADLWQTHFDFYLRPKGQFELHVSTPGRLLWYEPAPEGNDPAPGDSVRFDREWSLRGAFVPGWVGPFYVAADGADRHFVVPGGRVFTLPADAKPGSALVKTWDADPVLALVHDADAGKSYAFNRTHYFPITSKPDPKPHALTAFPGATAEEALDTVARCGRVIRGLK